jgi:FAD/FMN-containing dehydrogenase
VHIRIGMDWNDAASTERLMTWADDTRRRLRPSSGERIYSNYQSHAGQGAADAVFGNNLGRLVAIKSRYDPTNVFQRNSNVRP